MVKNCLLRSEDSHRDDCDWKDMQYHLFAHLLKLAVQVTANVPRIDKNVSSKSSQSNFSYFPPHLRFFEIAHSGDSNIYLGTVTSANPN
jgi:hypothetical protein